MARLQIKYLAEMADGTVHEVTVDQRDFARLEAADIAEEAMHTRARFLVYNAMKRGKLVTSSFEKFNFEECMGIESAEQPAAEEEDAEDEQSLDPGRKPAGAGS